jgi:hypothetical protein
VGRICQGGKVEGTAGCQDLKLVCRRTEFVGKGMYEKGIEGSLDDDHPCETGPARLVRDVDGTSAHRIAQRQEWSAALRCSPELLIKRDGEINLAGSNRSHIVAIEKDGINYLADNESVLSPFRGIISEAIGAMLNVCVYYMPTKPEWRQPILLSQATAWPLRSAHCTSSVVFP